MPITKEFTIRLEDRPGTLGKLSGPPETCNATLLFVSRARKRTRSHMVFRVRDSWHLQVWVGVGQRALRY